MQVAGMHTFCLRSFTSLSLVIQLRMLDGTATVQTFQATDTLQEVMAQMGSTNTQLMTNFPKRVFSAADMERSLQELGEV